MNSILFRRLLSVARIAAETAIGDSVYCYDGYSENYVSNETIKAIKSEIDRLNLGIDPRNQWHLTNAEIYEIADKAIAIAQNPWDD